MDMQTIKATPVGVVGLGLMGSSIVVSLLVSGHRVVALAPIAGEKEKAASHIGDLLRHVDEAGLLNRGIQSCIDALTLVEDYRALAGCKLVLECVIEDKGIKEIVYHNIAGSVPTDTVIASNTSAIPISELQLLVPHPHRFLGIHWAEPAYMTRFLEVTCGALTDISVAERMVDLGLTWGKEPTLLKKDVRGFITNRLMYAVYREALSLIAEGHTSLEDADKVFRYDAGAWVTIMGVFERMVFTGLDNQLAVYKRLFPLLNNRSDVPDIMQKIVEEKGRGIHNQVGLYAYSPETAKRWEAAFARFNKDIYDLATQYLPEEVTNGMENHASINQHG